jgi:hypothetical protein
MPASRIRMPQTLKKSPAKAQRTYAETLESAEKTYAGNEERAHRAAFAAVKHSFEKVGDHWEPKKGGRKGPSDERAKVGGRSNRGRSAGGVDVEGHTRQELLARAKKLDITGRSRMTKMELGQAIAKRERSSTRPTARGGRRARTRS